MLFARPPPRRVSWRWGWSGQLNMICLTQLFWILTHLSVYLFLPVLLSVFELRLYGPARETRLIKNLHHHVT